MRTEEIQVVACLLEKYADIINRPTPDNRIELTNKMVRLIKDGTVLTERPISTQGMNLTEVEYKNNVFCSPDIAFSPLEADREDNVKYWKQSYNKINFPLFIPIPLISWLALGKIPDIVDFCKIYLLAYTETVTKSTYLNPLDVYAVNSNMYSNVGKPLIYTDGQILNNRILRFKPRYLKYVSGLPINQFTTEQICNRIYKAYGSCIRDPYNMLRMSEFGAKTVYDSYLDFEHCIDGKIGTIPYHGFSKTESAKKFRDKKVQERHKTAVAEKGIVLVQKGTSSNGVYLANDAVLMKIMTDILMKRIDDFIIYET